MILGFNAFLRRRNVFCMTCRSYATKPKPFIPTKRDSGAKPNITNSLPDRPYAVENTKPSNAGYPERLLIYNSGAFKTSTVAFSKLACFFLFGATCLSIAPHIYASPDHSNWLAVTSVVATGGFLVFYVVLTSPYVAQIYIRVPPQARTSRDTLWRFLKYHLPPKAEIDFTTVRLSGFQKTTSTTLQELRPLRHQIGRIANVGRLTEHIVAKRSWYARLTYWLREPRNLFYVGGKDGMARSRAPGAWQLVWRHIEKKPFLR